MRMSSNRATRAVDDGALCSCAHSVPLHCHNRNDDDDDDIELPSNVTMKLYTICYLGALQAPPRPLAISEKKSVIFTIEPFWLEPYWRELKLDNLTFHYDFVVKNPEHCEGGVVTSDDGVHFCNNVIYLNTTDEGEEDVRDEDYEHSDNYDQYDDELSEEVEIDRDIFVGAPEVQVYYIVDVNQPRQLDLKAPSGHILHDVKTSVESEILRYDLKSDFEPVDNLPLPIDSQEEDEDVSDEDEGTELFEDSKPIQNEQKKEEETDNEKLKSSSTVAAINADSDVDMKKMDESKALTSEDSTKPVTTVSLDSENILGKENEESGEIEDKEVNTNDNENFVEIERSTKITDVFITTHRSIDNDENYLSEQDDEDDSIDEHDMTFFEQIAKNKGILARFVFGTTIVICLLSILCICIFRRRCRNMGNIKSVGGHRYDSINTQTIPTLSEKERLNQ
ncbi:hypothetical protein DICVIV_05169 [Dictyocaulus viviparus]|uniref:Uncharacterized protein n=1 Tax=Dictyocaulus viviparus TaxID=29172 RepID=A0A0D8XVS6_DICVI|nr:hypothetical protein DICVIV_05169 [Dictyocaulus viviparus]